jgi:hypothetical protein
LKLVFLPQAKVDLADDMDPLLGQIFKRVQALRKYPLLGTALSGPFAGFRMTAVGHFRIVYRLEGKVVQVCYVRAGRRT